MKKILISIVWSVMLLLYSAPFVLAYNEVELGAGLAYLRTQQESSGKIAGFGGESQWAAIAFSAEGIDTASVQNPTTSLTEYLLNDQPAPGAAATEWERRILSIVAMGEDPSNFGGVNYVENLENLFVDNQLGATTLLNDDIFGILALLSSGSLVDSTILQATLDFVIDHQESDGGFNWSTETCVWCGSDNNDTAAALQALQAAKEEGLVHPDLDTAITQATAYLLSTQKPDGGFAYDAFSESDGSSTAWSLMALNVLGLEESAEAQQATAWLLANQENDGGFHWMIGYGSDTSTTSHAVIALSGASWILQPEAIGNSPSPSPSISPIPSASPIPSPTPTPSPTRQSSSTPTPSSTPSPTPPRLVTTSSPRPSVIAQVLGATTKESPIAASSPPPSPLMEAQRAISTEKKEYVWLWSLAILGGILSLIIGLKIWEKRKER
jgi:hypothetical protein